MKKRINWFYIVLVVALVILLIIILKSGFLGQNTNKDVSAKQLVTDLGDNYVFESVLDDGSVICLDHLSETGPAYYRYYFDSDTLVKIGTIENFMLNMSGMVQIDNSLYFFCYVEDNGEKVNMLFSIDTETNTISAHPNNDGSVAGIPVFLYGDNIATMKNVVEENQIYTFVDWYDRETDEWHQEHLNIYNSETKEGSAIVLMYSDESSLYLLLDIYSAPGIYKTYLKQYGFDGNELKSIMLPSEITDYFQQGRMFRMYIVDDYIYLADISSFGYIGKITETTIETIFTEDQLLFAANNKVGKDKMILFVRSTNRGYVLDIEVGELSEFTLELPEGQSICQLLVNENEMVINCYEEYDNDLLYEVDLDNVLSGAFSLLD